MTVPSAIKSPAVQIAEIDNPAPRDIDPEDFGGLTDGLRNSSSGSDEEEHGNAREHYLDIAQSKLRKPQQPTLGPKYSGSRVSRNTLLGKDESDDDPFGGEASELDGQSSEAETIDDNIANPDDVDLDTEEGKEDEYIDSDEAWGDGDEKQFKRFKFQGSNPSKRTTNGSKEQSIKVNGGKAKGSETDDDEMMSEDDNSEASDRSGIEGDSGSVASNPDNEGPRGDSSINDRATLRKMMAEQQKTIITTISHAAKADATKGRAVKHQRSTFDILLNTRIRLQKALVATNSLSAIEPPTIPANTIDHAADQTAIHAAETAALSLWNALSSLRDSLHLSSSPSKATTSFHTPSTSPAVLHDRLSALDAAALPTHRATLTKWAERTHLVSALPSHNRLSNASTHQPLTSILDTHLSAPNFDRLLARTRTPRSCAPLQAASQTAQAEDDAIFDDADFYTLLLRELVDQKMSAASTGLDPAAATLHGAGGIENTIDVSSLKREAKVRKKVDTKASKGRKMRYTVHEKLQNFVAREDRGTWGERQIGELFGGLLGRKVVALGEGEDMMEDDEEGGEDGLRLFRGMEVT